MIKRHMLLGYYIDKSYEIKNINNASITFYEDKVFLYFETEEDRDFEELAEEIVKINLHSFPGGEKWIEMIDIFHYSYPYNNNYWKRKLNNKKTVFKISYLKPEKVGEYVFYHYKLQREASLGYDKYGVIYMYRNMLVMYYEEPSEEVDTSLVENRWKKVIPDYDGNIIADLSIPFDDGFRGWRSM